MYIIQIIRSLQVLNKSRTPYTTLLPIRISRKGFKLDMRKSFFIKRWLGTRTDSPGKWSQHQACWIQEMFG